MKSKGLLVILFLTVFLLTSCSSSAPVEDNTIADDSVCPTDTYIAAVGEYLVVYDLESDMVDYNNRVNLFYAKGGTELTYIVDCDGLLKRATLMSGSDLLQRANYGTEPKYFTISKDLF